ncbi:phenylalanine--tRNA ligase subunit beta [Candidatus Saccharibacteria bacterium]|nr:phenylalanine--tRNA ligase subunit beta [Candidatus Saccharibacteria bacterium]NCU40229.1 phenylalanine--tRNA ligase subunit beta [Candidatus Saccharibacteria bacterium]
MVDSKRGEEKMIVSLNTIKQYIDFELPQLDELKKHINEQLGGIENVVDLGAKYQGIVIVKVVSTTQHFNADKLTICKVDDGGVVKDVPRDENGHVQVVCGAPNVHKDMFAVWLPPGVTVPASFDDIEPFVLSARELRGAVSQGMLAAPDELATGSDHTGIIELTEGDLPEASEIKSLEPGQNFAKVFGLDDIIIDIENKMFTHRPDCFGQLGVAREIAGILRHKFVSPSWYLDTPEFTFADSLELTVTNDAEEAVPRFMAVAFRDLTIKPSPFWLQAKLVVLGSKPINNVVDITNYVMLITAQPLHAYDYDKLAGHALGVRMGRSGEKLTLLNGKTYETTPEDIVIVDGEKSIGMGGIMGGGNSEVSADTKNIVLECATFDMYCIRKSSMRHGLFTDAVTRFNKGQSPLQNSAVLAKTISYFQDVIGSEQASKVFDCNNTAIDENFSKNDESLDGGIYANRTYTDFVNQRLGTALSNEEMHQLLHNVEFAGTYGTSADNQTLISEPFITFTTPFWRTDINLPEDIVEEIGRLNGFDKLPRELPKRSISPAPKNSDLEVKQQIRDSLVRAGANEVLCYSFVNAKTIEKAEQDVSRAYRLSNALSPDLQYYRLSILPSLLEKVHPNIKAGHDEFVLFEIGKSHDKTYPDYGDGLPTEQTSLDLVYASKKAQQSTPYYITRRYVEQLASDLGFVVKFARLADRVTGPFVDQFERSRTATVVAYYYRDKQQVELGEVGYVGELKQSVRKGFKLPEYCAGVTLDFHAIMQLVELGESSYRPLSRFPKVTQDISLKVADDVTYEQVFDLAQKIVADNSRNCDAKLSPLSIYQAKEDQGYKTITLRLEIASYDKTLTDKEVARTMDKISELEVSNLNAVRI